MSLKLKIILPVLTITLLLSFITFLLFSQAVERIENHFVAQITDIKVKDLDANIQRISKKAQTVAAMATTHPAVERAYALAASGQEEAGRALLLKELSSLQQQVQQVTGLKSFKLHYHLAPSRSFVRLWNGKGLDDLSSFRATVTQVHQTGQPLMGIEVGRGGFVMRGLAPIKNARGQVVGSVENLISLNSLVKVSKTLPEESFGVVMIPELLDIATKLQKNTVHLDKFIYTGGSKGFDKQIITPALLRAALKEQQVEELGHYRLVYNPVKDFSGRSVGVLIYQLDITPVKSMSHALFLQQAGVTVVLLLLATLLFWLIISRIILRISSINQTLGTLSQGDLSHTICIRSKYPDEVDAISDGINGLSASLKYMVSSIELQSKSLTAVVTQLHQTGDVLNDDSQSALTIAQQVVTSNSQLGQETSSIKSSVEQMMGNIGSIGEASQQQIETMNTIASSTQQAAGNVSTMASAAEEMSANVGSVNSAIGQVNQSMEEVQFATDEVRSSMGGIQKRSEQASDASRAASEQAMATLDVMEKLKQNAKEIDKVVDAINIIAQQTNMLALNASIEAAGAGEAGKGFAVVANEVKELAQQTSEATKMIAGKVQEIQQGSGTAAQAAREIADSIGHITQASGDILESVEEQAASMEGVNQSVTAVNSATQEVGRNMSELALASQEVARAAIEAATGMHAIEASVTLGVEATENTKQSVDSAYRFADEIVHAIRRTADFSEQVQQQARSAGEQSELMGACIRHLIHLVTVVEETSVDLNNAPGQFVGVKPDLDIETMKMGHLKWLGSLQGHLSGRHHRDIPPQDKQQCAIGTWLESQNSHPIAETAAFKALMDHHAEISQLGLHCIEDSSQLSDPDAHMTHLHQKRRHLFSQLDRVYLDHLAR
uniref:Putative methyl-accepting chemotaxis sensory transducer n=1 Tax=Magnetococcus massalia (strain MO-1) TaxID=451514 RepID=A0A1S7LKT0_MAGMO|nr:Putative methyl-accepting chemotaxis sensory transducer [Candidatus Magnetococcus massalia]